MLETNFVLSYDLVKSRSREIGSLNYRIALQIYRHIGSTAAEVLVKLQSDRMILIQSRVFVTLRDLTIRRLIGIETGPMCFCICHNNWQDRLSAGTGEFPAQMASNAENVSIWWCHYEGWDSMIYHSNYDTKSFVTVEIMILDDNIFIWFVKHCQKNMQ